MKPYLHRWFARLSESAGGGPAGTDSMGRGRAQVPRAPALQSLAAGLAALYGAGAWTRRSLYARRILTVKRLPAPVVSVGNITVGGTGKTPLVAYLARLFQTRGKRVAILSRGYGGRRREIARLSDGQRIYFQPPEAGEEAYWLARSLPGVAVFTGSCRVNAGVSAWEEMRPDLFLLDDGFQHLQLHRDLDLVLLDAGAPWGNGYLLPRGPLREPVAALAAAQVLVLTRFNAADASHRRSLESLQTRFPGKTVLTATISPAVARVFPGGREEFPAALKGLPLLAFSGLARPEVFTATLGELAVDLKGAQVFPDHYLFSGQDLQGLVREAAARGAAGLITTGKDWARLGENWTADLPLWVLEVEARLEQPLPEWVIARILGGGPGI